MNGIKVIGKTGSNVCCDVLKLPVIKSMKLPLSSFCHLIFNLNNCRPGLTSIGFRLNQKKSYCSCQVNKGSRRQHPSVSPQKKKEPQLTRIHKMSIISDKQHGCQSDTLHVAELLSLLAWPLAYVSLAQQASEGGPAVSAVSRRFLRKKCPVKN